MVNRSVVIGRMIFVCTIILIAASGLIYAPPADADESVSLQDQNYKYARIYTTRVKGYSHALLEDLEALVREKGTEEISMFLEENGPENEEYRWILREGSDGYAYPGLTVMTRSHLVEMKTSGMLTVSGDGLSATEQLDCFDEPIRWIYPRDNNSPLVCHIFDKGVLRGVITVHEIPSPFGRQRWPVIMRMDDLVKDECTIQVFEYLDQKPKGLPPRQEGPVLGECELAKLPEMTQSDRPTIISRSGATTYSIDFVNFHGKWGCDGLEVNWWLHELSSAPSWFDCNLHFGARALISSDVSGSFLLTEGADTTLTAQSGEGFLAKGFELGIWADVYVTNVCLGWVR